MQCKNKRVYGQLEALDDKLRTSTTAWCMNECSKSEVMTTIFDKIESLLDIPQANAEKMQLVRYNARAFIAIFNRFMYPESQTTSFNCSLILEHNTIVIRWWYPSSHVELDNTTDTRNNIDLSSCVLA
jgi:DNA-directed RNA polymerase